MELAILVGLLDLLISIMLWIYWICCLLGCVLISSVVWLCCWSFVDFGIWLVVWYGWLLSVVLLLVDAVVALWFDSCELGFDGWAVCFVFAGCWWLCLVLFCCVYDNSAGCRILGAV